MIYSEVMLLLDTTKKIANKVLQEPILPPAHETHAFEMGTTGGGVWVLSSSVYICGNRAHGVGHTTGFAQLESFHRTGLYK